MNLEMVTLTGADDNTDIEEMFRISKDFPFVEWGILLSKSKLDSDSQYPRFPGLIWLDRLIEAVHVNPPINISVHICGSYVRELLRGRMCLLGNKLLSIADRVQLNFHGEVLDVDRYAFEEAIIHSSYGVRRGAEIIYQLDGVNDWLLKWMLKRGHHRSVGLYDNSHGNGVFDIDRFGVVPDFTARSYGYAGGIGVGNLCDVIFRLLENSKGEKKRAWIDMESSLRSDLSLSATPNDAFDLLTCRNVLEICKPWIMGVTF